ncbi:glycoside hydrolase family 16 protein [Zopfia rhizophila CBS 207.26]|uniref:endo-1,3(4)-beta-glucanase n=1 Tax=Zopfia rhizophila CBS 207.26 TaxID=1314779 RepID=A0A6A6D8Z1_9PEZI|nr:glycoside hydrolase family 16 protein [Zopfia rhizophila CBS 207.26]
MGTFALTSLSAAKYTLKDDLSHKNFFPNFELFNGPDPTKGFVQYQSLGQAIENQYISYINKSVYLGVDFQNKTPEGRPSIRVEGTKRYNKGLLVADINHMPGSICGTWPAMWMFESPWPTMGEIDILEGVNDHAENAVTLHTSSGCMVDNSTSGGEGQKDKYAPFIGTMETSDCDVNAPNQSKNRGCSIKAPTVHADPELSLPSYGDSFNEAGGGIHAMEWTSKSISVWFFPRNGTDSPKDVSDTPDPSQWGTPLAKFQGSGCDFEERFKDLKIVFDTTFCGEWAGKKWDKSCAAKTKVAKCEDYVRDNPEAFTEAYWEIAGLKWFENDEKPSKIKKDQVVHRASSNHKSRRYNW